MANLHLVEPLLTLSFADRVEVAHILGLSVACCPGCGCYIGSPDCHDARMSERVLDAVSELSGGTCEGCPDMERPCRGCGEPLADGEDELCVQCEDHEEDGDA